MVDKRPLIGFDVARHTGISHQGNNSLNFALARRGRDDDKEFFEVQELPAGLVVIRTGTTLIGEASQTEIFQKTLTIRRR